VLRKRASAMVVTIVMVLRVAMSTERVWSKRASCRLQGKHQQKVDAVTLQGAVTARENVRRNRYRVKVCLQVVHRHKIRPESQAASAYSTTRVMHLGP
jgi:hypothetical protein